MLRSAFETLDSSWLFLTPVHFVSLSDRAYLLTSFIFLADGKQRGALRDSLDCERFSFIKYENRSSEGGGTELRCNEVALLGLWRLPILLTESVRISYVPVLSAGFYVLLPSSEKFSTSMTTILLSNLSRRTRRNPRLDMTFCVFSVCVIALCLTFRSTFRRFLLY